MVKDFEIKRGVLLPVSAPFHCSLMQPAAERMAEALAEAAPGPLALPLYANVTASTVTDPAEEQRLLVEQVTGRVRWRESVQIGRAWVREIGCQYGSISVLAVFFKTNLKKNS